MIIKNPVYCPICGHRTTWRISIRRHFIVHHGPAERCQCIEQVYINGEISFSTNGRHLKRKKYLLGR